MKKILLTLFILFSLVISCFSADTAKQVDFLLSGYQSPSTGEFLSGGKIYTYLDGTSTLSALWTDKDKGGTATNPIILDSAGKAEVFGDNIYKFEIYDSNDVLVETLNGLQYFASIVEEKSLKNDYGCDLEVALSAIGASTRTQLNVDCDFTFDDGDTLTVTENIILNVTSGSFIGPSGGSTETLNINGAFKAPKLQVFTNVTVNFGLQSVKRTQVFHCVWWDNDISDGSNKYTVLQTVMNALPVDDFGGSPDGINRGLIVIPPGMAYNKGVNSAPLQQNLKWNQAILDLSGMFSTQADGDFDHNITLHLKGVSKNGSKIEDFAIKGSRHPGLFLVHSQSERAGGDNLASFGIRTDTGNDDVANRVLMRYSRDVDGTPSNQANNFSIILNDFTQERPKTTFWEYGGINHTMQIGDSGTHDGANGAAVLTDSGASWTINGLEGLNVRNTTDGSAGVIVSNTATTITATLLGGTDDDWDTGDSYVIAIGALGDSPVFVLEKDDGTDVFRIDEDGDIRTVKNIDSTGTITATGDGDFGGVVQAGSNLTSYSRTISTIANGAAVPFFKATTASATFTGIVTLSARDSTAVEFSNHSYQLNSYTSNQTQVELGTGQDGNVTLDVYVTRSGNDLTFSVAKDTAGTAIDDVASTIEVTIGIQGHGAGSVFIVTDL